jgi:hypothetical protein
MREQLKAQDRDIAKMREEWTLKGHGKLDAFRGFTLGQYAFFQNLCNIPGWMKSYELGLVKFGGDDAKAIRYADMVIRTTQSAPGIADLTYLETSGTWRKMFTMFYSWYRIMLNKGIETKRRIQHEPGAIHKMGLFMKYAFGYLVIGRMIGNLMRFRKDDDEPWTRWLLREAGTAVVLSPLESVPVVRDLTSFALNKAGYEYRFTPLSAAGESAGNLLVRAGGAIADAWGDEEIDWGGLADSGGETLGYALKLPERQFRKWLEVIYDAATDEEDFLEGAYRVLLGRRKKERSTRDARGADRLSGLRRGK